MIPEDIKNFSFRQKGWNC